MKCAASIITESEEPFMTQHRFSAIAADQVVKAPGWFVW